MLTRAAEAPAPAVPTLAPETPPPSLIVADATVFFDAPSKTAGIQRAGDLLPMAAMLNQAHERVTIVSPYFLPSVAGMQRLKQARERGVQVLVLTNSLLDSDEPLVSVAYGHRRMALLQAGVHLFELSSERLHRQASLRQALGSTVGRLHAKLGFIDDHTLLVGSMNLDPRSASTNTELALAVHSPALTRLVLAQLTADPSGGSYEVRLTPDGQSLEWVSLSDQDEEHLPDEPAPPWWQRLRLWLLSLLVPDDLL